MRRVVITQPVPSASGGRAHEVGLFAGGKVSVVADSLLHPPALRLGLGHLGTWLS